jgi:hypothetical protein
MSRRRDVLSFTHHAEVAALPPADADALLDWCEETRNRRIFVREKDPLPIIDEGGYQQRAQLAKE